jgi:hypothetical protein
MKEKKSIVLILFILFASYLNAQEFKRSWSWVTGYSGNRVFFKNGFIKTSIGLNSLKYFTAGNSCISSSDGNLLLTSSGFDLFDSAGNIIDNGGQLIPENYYTNQSGSSFGSQTSIILPMDSSIYYFITPTFSNTRFNECYNNNGNCYFDLLLYNLIDMNANGGLGKVTKRMVPLMQNANLRKTQMMACRHGNGKDWWLLKNEGDNADVHTFLFTQD